MTRDYAERARKNQESAERATAHREPWDPVDSQDLMDYWDGRDERLLEELAEMLGRTIEACRQRYYVVLSGGVSKKTPAHQGGWLYAFCTECGSFTDVWCDGTNVKKCEDCK